MQVLFKYIANIFISTPYKVVYDLAVPLHRIIDDYPVRV